VDKILNEEKRHALFTKMGVLGHCKNIKDELTLRSKNIVILSLTWILG